MSSLQFNESDRCPICGAINVLDFPGMPDTFYRGETWQVDGETVAHGTACWDAPFGDECGACLNTVLNTETALIGPRGMCHPDDE